MTLDKKSRDLLTELGYDPDDPAMSVEWVQQEGTPVTATETSERKDELTAALQEAITALRRVLKLIA